MILEVFELAVKVVQLIVDGVSKGQTNAQIRKRIAAPQGVGDQLITAIRNNHVKIRNYVKNG